MTTDELLVEVLTQLSALSESVATLDARQQAVESSIKVIEQQVEKSHHNFQLLARALGLLHIRVSAEAPYPEDMLEDDLYLPFLKNYPEDGPPVITAEEMRTHVERFAEMDDSTLASGWAQTRELHHLTMYQLLRNRQIEREVRKAVGDFDKAVTRDATHDHGADRTD